MYVFFCVYSSLRNCVDRTDVFLSDFKNQKYIFLIKEWSQIKGHNNGN